MTEKFYMGAPCKRGHDGLRYKSTRTCVACQAQHCVKLSARREARNMARSPDGVTFVGNPCKHGHDGTRYVKGNACVGCMKKRETTPERRSAVRAWSIANKERIAETKRLREYDITPVEYNFMFAGQGFRCGICEIDEPCGKYRAWHTDHCHGSGKVRGVLCANCNPGIGYFKDSPELLQGAIDYLCETMNLPLPTSRLRTSTKPTSEMAGPPKASPPIAPNAKPRPSLRLVTSSQNFVGQSRKSA